MQTIELRSSSHPDPGQAPAARGDVWIDIDAVDDEGRQWLAGQSGLDEEIVGRLLDPAPATYWRRFGQALHFNLHLVAPVGNTATLGIVDFGILLEPGRIITLRRGQVPPLDRAAEACSLGAGPSSAWELIVFVLSEALTRLEQNLHELTASIDQLEDEILGSEGDLPIQRVGELRKRLVYVRRVRMPLANMVSFISSQPSALMDPEARDDLDAIVSSVAQHQELLSLSIDRASALQGQIRDQLADSMNAATYRFTWVATVFLPLSFLTGLLGINVAGIPGNHNPLAFWLVCAALCVVAAIWGVAVGQITGARRRRRSPRRH